MKRYSLSIKFFRKLLHAFPFKHLVIITNVCPFGNKRRHQFLRFVETPGEFAQPQFNEACLSFSYETRFAKIPKCQVMLSRVRLTSSQCVAAMARSPGGSVVRICALAI